MPKEIGELPNNLQEIKNYQKKGRLFHGSASPNIDLFEPRQATPVEGSPEFDNDKAVYASNLPETSVLFACMGQENFPDEERKGEWGVDESEGKFIANIPTAWRPYLEQNVGYVYILDQKDFDERSKDEPWQHKSKKEVRPNDRIDVKFSDFETIGGEIHWT